MPTPIHPAAPAKPTPTRRHGTAAAWMLHRRPLLVAATVLLIGLAITLVVAQREFAAANRADELHFHQLADRVHSEMTRRIIVFRHGLTSRDAAGLIEADEMSRLSPQIFEDITAVTDEELDIEVFNGSITTAETLIFDADNHLTQSLTDSYNDTHYTNRLYHQTRLIEIGGLHWTVTLSTTPGFRRISRASAQLTLIGGTLLSLLLSALVYSFGSSTRRAWALADDMTADLRALAHAAEQATRAKSAFLANMSHEIRTPMTAILGFAELLEQQIDHDNREILGYTETIKRNGKHLIAIINDVLDLSKIEAGKMTVERIAIHPDILLADILSLMQVKAAAKNLTLCANLTTPIPRTIQTDPVRLRQILVNLVGNAIKFTDAGTVTINAYYTPDSRTLSFDVIDTGRGMTPKQSNQLFGAFQQADSSTTREFGGTGLGLHISQRLADMLGGTIRFTTALGQGSTFTATIVADNAPGTPLLPAGPFSVVTNTPPDNPAAPSSDPCTDPAPTSDADSDALPLRGLRILVADDGPDNQRLLNHHLSKAGATVTLVDNGKLAVQALTGDGQVTGSLAEPAPFDLMLCDMQMPEMDGYTAVRLLRDKGCTLPIIALTAHAMSGDADKCLAAGCNDYATKPISRDELIALCQPASPAGV